MSKTAIQIEVSPPLTVGERVLLIRLTRSMSQTYVAAKLGCHQVRISQLEGADRLPGLYFDRLVELVQLLGTSSDFMLGLSDAVELDDAEFSRYLFVLDYIKERRVRGDVRWEAFCRERSFAAHLSFNGRRQRAASQPVSSW
jgi:transcriptional regulator with XRE-family HTH domain